MTKYASAVPASALRFRAEAFGMGWAGELPMPGFQSAADSNWPQCTKPDIEVRVVDRLPPRDLGLPVNMGHLCADGIRLHCRDEAVFDMKSGQTIHCCPGPGWRETLPVGFYGTLAALTSCWHAGIPLHASAIAWRDRAILLLGRSGSGKSTTTAALLMAGAGFMGDDLSVAFPMADGSGECIAPGRPTLRLHPATAALIPSLAPMEPPRDSTGKCQIRPAARIHASLPLGAMLMLDQGHAAAAGPMSPFSAVTLLPAHLFRPRWQSILPGYQDALTRLLALAARIPVAIAPSLPGFDALSLKAHGHMLLDLIDSLPG